MSYVAAFFLRRASAFVRFDQVFYPGPARALRPASLYGWRFLSSVLRGTRCALPLRRPSLPSLPLAVVQWDLTASRRCCLPSVAPPRWFAASSTRLLCLCASCPLSVVPALIWVLSMHSGFPTAYLPIPIPTLRVERLSLLFTLRRWPSTTPLLRLCRLSRWTSSWRARRVIFSPVSSVRSLTPTSMTISIFSLVSSAPSTSPRLRLSSLRMWLLYWSRVSLLLSTVSARWCSRIRGTDGLSVSSTAAILACPCVGPDSSLLACAAPLEVRASRPVFAP